MHKFIMETFMSMIGGKPDENYDVYKLTLDQKETIKEWAKDKQHRDLNPVQRALIEVAAGKILKAKPNVPDEHVTQTIERIEAGTETVKEVKRNIFSSAVKKVGHGIVDYVAESRLGQAAGVQPRVKAKESLAMIQFTTSRSVDLENKSDKEISNFLHEYQNFCTQREKYGKDMSPNNIINELSNVENLARYLALRRPSLHSKMGILAPANTATGKWIQQKKEELGATTFGLVTQRHAELQKFLQEKTASFNAEAIPAQFTTGQEEEVERTEEKLESTSAPRPKSGAGYAQDTVASPPPSSQSPDVTAAGRKKWPTVVTDQPGQKQAEKKQPIQPGFDQDELRRKMAERKKKAEGTSDI